jgi:hypothetical protein
MKLLIRNNLVIGVATDDYFGPEHWITQPAGFDINMIGSYTLVNGVLEIPAAMQAQDTFNSLMSGGITLTSTGTPALNGTYSTMPNALINISGIASSIVNGLGLPGGGTTFNYRDTSGVAHTFDSSHFIEFAKAVRDFVYQCEETLNTIQLGGTATFPSNQITIS